MPGKSIPAAAAVAFTVFVCAATAALAEGPKGFDLAAAEEGNESFIKVYGSSGRDIPYPLWDDDPLSSAWVLVIDGEFLTPSDSDWVREDRIAENGRVVTYSNRVFSMAQRVTVSTEGNHAKAVMTLTNNSTDAVNVVPMLLLDTILGETTGLPFLLPNGTYIKNETLLDGADIPDWIKTVRDSSTPALAVVFSDRISDDPESILAANWLRMKQRIEAFKIEEGRNFDYLPFSEADSALLIRYGSKRLAPGGTMETTVVFGFDENVPRPEEFNRRANETVDAGRENVRLREYTIRQRLREIASAVAAIDALLEDEGSIDAETVADVEKQVGQQERLRAEYENL